MSTPASLYPVTPVNVPESVTKTSAAFKAEVSKVMGSIVLFFVVYLLLIALAVALAAAAVYGGLMLIIALPKFLTLMIGIGLFGLGLMVIFFLVKFIFAVSRFDRSNSIEIKEGDQPRLFEFIRRLTTETATPFPKRIYLSPEVNACVFYDSGFWSMFLPVKKNLQIGLGLVNSVNLSEFKAIMAHEFGHFSQRSMKLGSFVYNVNRVIYNMLFENTSYGRSLEKWASVSSYFAFFANITVTIVNGIQWVLRHMYSLVNKNYMSLSREMEFHADAVAASVSGSENCISALRRVEFAASCYSTLIEKCNDLYKEKYITANVYHNQQSVFRQLAKTFNLPLHNELPVVNEEFLKTLHNNRVNFKDQWASHPSLEERAKHLTSLGVAAETSNDSAWVLFENAEDWQLKLTGKLYNGIEITSEIKTLDVKAFDQKLQEDEQLYSLPEAYKGFYDKRQVSILNIDELCSDQANAASGELKFENIFNEENAGLYKKITMLQNDVQVLNAIAAKQIRTKTFDFDGEKYDAGQAKEIAEKLEAELGAVQKQLEDLDKNAFRYFYRQAMQKDSAAAGRLKKGWEQYYNWRNMADGFLNKANEIMMLLQPLFAQQGFTIQQASQLAGELKNGEARLKPMLTLWLDDGAFDPVPNFKEQVHSFIASDFQYFSGESFIDNEINTVCTVINDAWRHIVEFKFKKLKEILEMQLSAN